MADILPSPAGQGHRQTLLPGDSEDTSGKTLLTRLLKRPILLQKMMGLFSEIWVKGLL
jgi:hypothetical protein